jgi:hypothetical protein
VWACKAVTSSFTPFELADKPVAGGALASKPTLLPQPEQLPWELSHARHHSPVIAHAAHPRATPAAANPFQMLSSLGTLPNPMLVESTLSMPSVPVLQAGRHEQLDISPHRPPIPATQGPDGELWPPHDPFHSYGGPSAFGPTADWEAELEPIAADDAFATWPPRLSTMPDWG